jgi:hypothetical protein
MPSTQNIAIAGAAGIIILGGAAWFAQDNLKLWSGGIHSVDFRNAQVEVIGTTCADTQLTAAGVTKLPLHDGAYQLGQYQFEVVGDVRYGDVSGHTGESSSDRAVFVGSCSNAGKTSQVLFVYGMEDGKPERVASADLSATGNTLVQSYDVSNGAIQVNANQGDPPTLVHLSYALLNGNLVNLNPAAAAPQTAPSAPAAATEVADNSADATVGEDQINFQTFHDELTPYGQWVKHPVWGVVWHPTAVPNNFQPYREGHWEDSDEYGTVWVSDYNWGDVPFHYGRWGYDPNYGWLWQPGYTWSPAWVTWRAGNGDIGWFPIPPNYYDGTAAFVDNWDGWYGYRALYPAMDLAAFYGMWSFVPADDIYAPGIAVDVIAPSVYAGFIGRTVGWTRFGMVRGHLANFAIDRGRFRATFGHPLLGVSRHDFLGHHGPIIGVARGGLIASHQHVSIGVGHSLGHGVGVHTTLATHFGPGIHHTASFGHATVHSPYHSFGSTHAAAGSGFVQHGSFGSTSHSSFAGSQRGSFGAPGSGGFGGSQHSTFGGGQHSAFGGGTTAQHSFGGGSYAQRPATSGTAAFGGASRAPQVQAPRPTSSGSAPHHH